VLNYFKNDHQNEDDLDADDPELGHRDSGILSKVTGIAKKGLTNIEKSTYKNKYIKKFARNTGSVFNKIQSSDDPMSELGPGISTYHQLLVMLFSLFFLLAIVHIPVLRSFRSFDYYDNDE
jgi:hypothetical protein